MATTIQDLPGEIWKPVVGYDGRYSVSNKGRVRTESHVARGRWGHQRLRARILRPGSASGYPVVRLGRSRPYFVHRLVLEAFVGPRPEGMEACHNNGDRTDNRAENLRWDTRTNNHADKVAHGTAPRGENNSRAKLAEDDVLAIRQQGGAPHELAEAYGVSRHTIARILAQKTWKHV